MTSINKTTKFSKDKISATSIILLLIASMAGALVFVPSANAAQAIPTNVINHYSYVYCSVASNVIGVGQDQIFAYWTADIPPDTGETELIIPGAFNRAIWTGVSFTVTTPSGVTSNLPVPSGQQDSIGGGYLLYSPTEIGVYTVKAIFPEQWKNSTLILAANGNGTYVSTPRQAGYPTPTSQFYTAGTSENVTFTVQQDPIALWPVSPVPTDYWTRPINSGARSWSFMLGGNWLNGAWNQPTGQAGGTTTRFVYGLGTETSHVLWTRTLYAGGYAEARFGDYGYQTGHYQGMDFSSIILNGRVYYADRADAYRSIGFNVVDLNTGELLGYYNDTMPSYGQLYKYESPNQHGIYPLLWRSASLGSGNGTSLEMLDGYSLPLRHICYIANTSATGTNVVGNNGELLWYNLVNKGTATNPNYYLTCWNNTNVLGETATGPNTGTTYWQWRPEGGGFGGGPALSNAYVWDGSTGFSVNASITTPYNTRNAILNQTGSIRSVRVGDTNGVGGFVIVGTQGQNNEAGNVQGQLWCYSLERGQEGKQLWASSFTAPYSSIAQNDTTLSLTGVYPEDGVIIFHSTKQLKYWGYDMKTGTLLWESAREPDQNYYSVQVNYYNGLLLTSGYGGVVIAYNMTTGQQAWNFTAANIGGESPYGNFPINIFAICDGKIYTLAGEHSVTQPLWRGHNIRCISATDGSEIWSLLGMGADNGAHLTGMYMQFGDGKVVGLNYFDNQIYCIGPGTSATTVSAPQTVPALGSSVMITGTVTDQTKSGRRNMNNLYDFTLEGTPAISDASMTAWMEYLFENQAKPTDATGVPVSLSAIDPNGNLVTIGTTASDMNGNYGLLFKPDVPGTYQIIASFAGSKAYGSSQSTTYLSVGEAPTVTPGPTATPESAADMYIIPATIGIIVAIVIAAIVIVLALRKRP
jgi:outer membrane protein assembly factor BamB